MPPRPPWPNPSRACTQQRLRGLNRCSPQRPQVTILFTGRFARLQPAGFIAHDAECLARAWLAQSTRTGQFDAALWPSDPRDFGLQPTPRASAFVTCPQALGLYAVLPDADWVGRMARGRAHGTAALQVG